MNTAFSHEKKKLLETLAHEIESMEALLEQVSEAEALPAERFRSFSRASTMLANKHIPAELCSEIKLLERIDEVQHLMDDLKNEVTDLL